MKLDASMLRYLGPYEFRVLAAIEQLMKNHEMAPKKLIPRIAGLKPSLTFIALRELHKHKLVFHDSKHYDGYRLTYSGYDYLAMKALSNRDELTFVGVQIGCGKESDIYTGKDGQGEQIVMKLHRLGRTSFRTIKLNRDYLEHRKHASWMYMARLAALKEFAFMNALYDEGFPCPRPIHVNRHIVLMEQINARTLSRVRQLDNPELVYARCMELIVRLGSHGLIHCDFNEFNLMLDADDNVIVIDFPQVISIDHPNAAEYFHRDVMCVHTYFKKRYRFIGEELPSFERDVVRNPGDAIDRAARASGFDKEKERQLQRYLRQQRKEEEAAMGCSDGDSESDDDVDDSDDDDDDDDEVDDSDDGRDEISEDDDDINNININNNDDDDDESSSGEINGAVSDSDDDDA